MADDISRFNSPAKLDLINTYVPLPYEEINSYLKNKQKDYDTQKVSLENSTKYFDLKIPQYLKLSTGETKENPDYQIYKQYKDQFNNELSEIQNSGIDYTSSLGREKVRNTTKKAVDFYSKFGRTAEEQGKEFEDTYKNWEGYKWSDKQGNFLQHDSDVYDYISKGGIAGGGFYKSSKPTDYVDKVKIVNDELQNIKSQIIKTDPSTGLTYFNDPATGEKMNLPVLKDGTIVIEGVTKDRIKEAVSSLYQQKILPITEQEIQYQLLHKGKKDPTIFNQDKPIYKTEYDRDKQGNIVDEKGRILQLKGSDKPLNNADLSKARTKNILSGYSSKADRAKEVALMKDYEDIENQAINIFSSSTQKGDKNYKFLPKDYLDGSGKKEKEESAFTTIPGYAYSLQEGQPKSATDLVDRIRKDGLPYETWLESKGIKSYTNNTPKGEQTVYINKEGKPVFPDELGKQYDKDNKVFKEGGSKKQLMDHTINNIKDYYTNVVKGDPYLVNSIIKHISNKSQETPETLAKDFDALYNTAATSKVLVPKTNYENFGKMRDNISTILESYIPFSKIYDRQGNIVEDPQIKNNIISSKDEGGEGKSRFKFAGIEVDAVKDPVTNTMKHGFLMSDGTDKNTYIIEAPGNYKKILDSYSQIVYGNPENLPKNPVLQLFAMTHGIKDPEKYTYKKEFNFEDPDNPYVIKVEDSDGKIITEFNGKDVEEQILQGVSKSVTGNKVE